MTHLIFALVMVGQTSGWVGQRVITKDGAELKAAEQVVDDADHAKDLAKSVCGQNAFLVNRVEQVNGPWLWLVAENTGAKGWVQASRVVRFDRSIEYSTVQICANPGSSWGYVFRGCIWLEKHELDLAIGDYSEAIRLDPQGQRTL